MSQTKRNSPSGFSTRAIAAMVASCTKRRFQCRRFGHGSGWIRSIRASDCGGAHASSSAASPANSLMLPMLMRLDLRQDLRHAVDVGLAADEAGLRKRLRFGDQMFAAAESDFEPDIVDGRLEQLSEIGRARRGDVERELRQQMLDQIGLVRAELVALAPSEERAARVRAGVIVGRCVAVPPDRGWRCSSQRLVQPMQQPRPRLDR